MSEKNPKYRNDVAMLSELESKAGPLVLVVKLHGYPDDQWRLPQGAIKGPDAMREDVERVMKSLVDCSDFYAVKDTKRDCSISYVFRDSAYEGVGATGEHYLGKNLRLFYVDLACDSSTLVKGPRVQAITFLQKSQLESELYDEEFRLVEPVLDHIYDPVKYNETLEELRRQNKK